MPTAFVGHGNPMNVLGGPIADAWGEWGRALQKPSAVLVVSAHFEARPPTLSSVSGAPLIYDFYGFPEEMYRVAYQPPPAPDLAESVERLLGVGVGVDADRGLDHGAWVPLARMYPDADIPVVQLSIPWTDDPAEMFRLGVRLAPLRDEEVLILGSGNLVHNLRRVVWDGDDGIVPWAEEFDGWVEEALGSENQGALARYREHPLAGIAHPTHEHFVPVLVAAGAAIGDEPSYPVTGFELGSISARSVQFG